MIIWRSYYQGFAVQILQILLIFVKYGCIGGARSAMNSENKNIM